MISDGLIKLRAVETYDIESIRVWRNQQMNVLRQSKMLTPEKQKEYFDLNVWPEKLKCDPKQILFAVELDRKLIGYGGIVHISWTDKRAEVSFLLAPEFSENKKLYANIFRRFLNLLKQIAFMDIGLHKLWTETYDLRPDHVLILEESGFVKEGVLREHNQIDLRRVDSLIHGCLNT